jgi:hypothetical protein
MLQDPNAFGCMIEQSKEHCGHIAGDYSGIYFLSPLESSVMGVFIFYCVKMNVYQTDFFVKK